MKQTASLLLALFLLCVPTHAGTIKLAWDPVDHADLTGYRIEYGEESRSYTGSLGVGPVTAATVEGLDDCKDWYLAIKACDGQGVCSDEFSNEVSGWPAPYANLISPNCVKVAAGTHRCEVTGGNFMAGVAVGAVENYPGVTVANIDPHACDHFEFDLIVTPEAQPGTLALKIVNPTLVFGVADNLIIVDTSIRGTIVIQVTRGDTEPAQ